MQPDSPNLKRPLLNQSKRQFSIMDMMNISKLQKQRETLIESYIQKKHKRKKHKKVVVGNNTSFDMTQFFKFKKQKHHHHKEGDLWINQFKYSYWAWIAVIYAMFNNSLLFPWIISISADNWLRLGWRNFFLCLILIPFMLYQKRKCQKQGKLSYHLNNIFKKSSLKNAFIISISKSLWLMVIVTCFRYNTIAHVLILGMLTNFFLSVSRFFSNNYHFFQLGGQISVIFGIFLIIKDDIIMNMDVLDKDYMLLSFMGCSWQTRLTADFVALMLSVIMAFFTRYTPALNNDYPSYLGLFIMNLMTGIELMLGAYFCHGASFDTDIKHGIFGLFVGQHISTFFQLSMFIGFGMLFSYTMIANLFSQPLIPSLIDQFQPIFSLMIIDFCGFQQFPNGFTVMGYMMILPGMCSILIGQNIFQKLKKQQQKQIKQKIKQIDQRTMSMIQIAKYNYNDSLIQDETKMPEKNFSKESMILNDSLLEWKLSDNQGLNSFNNGNVSSMNDIISQFMEDKKDSKEIKENLFDELRKYFMR